MTRADPMTLLRRHAKTAAFFGALACVIGGLRNPTHFFQSYLYAALLFIGLSVGCLGLFLLYRLVGGAWGKASLPVLEAGVKTLPCAALLILPVLLGLHFIYPWTHPEHLAGFARKILFFNQPFFIARTVVYFALWIGMAVKLLRPTANPQRLGALGLMLYIISVSFASFDWMMSLEPHWSSSIYGAMIMVGDLLSALALIVVTRAWLIPSDASGSTVSEDTALDLGNLLLAFVMLWTYMALSQYLIIWSANLPEEIPWYLVRQEGGWQYVVLFLILFQFVIPFFLLLVRKRKQKLQSLARVATGLLLMRGVDLYWLVMPDFSPGHLRIHYLDIGALLLVGSAWALHFSRQFPEVRRG